MSTETPALPPSQPPKIRGPNAAAEERLLPGEVIVESAYVHNGIFWQAAAVFGLAFLVAIFIAAELGALLAVVAVLMAIYAIIRKEVLMFVVTNMRVLARHGLLQVDVIDILFDKVESMELQRMLPGYLMGYANIVLMGTGNRYIVIPYVANGVAVRRAYNEQSLAVKEAKK